MLANTMTGAPWKEYDRKRRTADSTRQAREDSARTKGIVQRARTEAEKKRDLGDRGMEIRRLNAQRLIRGGCVTTIGTDNYLGQAPEFRRDPKPAWQDPGTGSIAAIEGLVELGMTPLQAIVERGGFVDDANTDQVLYISRVGTAVQSQRLDLEAVMDGDSTEQIVMSPDDIIIVPRTFIGEADVWVDQWIRGLLPTVPRPGLDLNTLAF
jgi:hypothetical protein